MSAEETNSQLVDEFRTVFHKGPSEEEVERGCEIIEELMKRGKAATQ